jgi:nucleoside-diphosphate-sugar epimerase
MRLLLIGGSGFIGRFLVPGLQREGHELAVFHRGRSAAPVPSGVTSLLGDRHELERHAGELRAFAPEVVIDLVASSAAHAAAVRRVFRGVARRTVVLSSIDVYRAAAVLHRLDPGPVQPLPLTEGSELRAETATYPPEQIRMLQQVFPWLDDAYDKVAVERTAQDDPALPATVLRLPMIYGPGDPLHRLQPLVQRVADRRPAILLEQEVAGWRSPRGYVENVAAAIALAATAEPAAGRTYNVAEPEALTELEWARLVTAAMDWDGELVVLPAERTPAHLRMPGNLAQHWVADSTRIRAELGYREPVPRSEAIRRTIDWEVAHLPAERNPALFDYAAEDAALAAV